MTVYGENMNPLDPESFNAVFKASILSFSSKATTVTPALNAPIYMITIIKKNITYATSISAELV
jgi:hypothetical protein